MKKQIKWLDYLKKNYKKMTPLERFRYLFLLNKGLNGRSGFGEVGPKHDKNNIK